MNEKRINVVTDRPLAPTQVFVVCGNFMFVCVIAYAYSGIRATPGPTVCV